MFTPEGFDINRFLDNEEDNHGELHLPGDEEIGTHAEGEDATVEALLDEELEDA
jgi:hypothetical protein